MITELVVGEVGQTLEEKVGWAARLLLIDGTRTGQKFYDSKGKTNFCRKEKLGFWKYIFIHCIAFYIELKHNRKPREFANFKPCLTNS